MSSTLLEEFVALLITTKNSNIPKRFYVLYSSEDFSADMSGCTCSTVFGLHMMQWNLVLCSIGYLKVEENDKVVIQTKLFDKVNAENLFVNKRFRDSGRHFFVALGNGSHLDLSIDKQRKLKLGPPSELGTCSDVSLCREKARALFIKCCLKSTGMKDDRITSELHFL